MAMGVVHSMLNAINLTDWLVPQIAGVTHTDYPPLYYWLSALSAKAWQWLLPLHDGARLASGFLMLVTLVYLYKSANKLFDVRAGRIAIALLIGSLGLLLRAHEMNPELGALAGMSVAIYGLTRIRFEARKGGVTAGVGALIMALSVGLMAALIVPVIAVTMLIALNDKQNRAFINGIVICTAMLLAGASIYPLVLWVNGLLTEPIFIDAVIGAPLFDAHARSAISPWYFIPLLTWYALPTLPMALWLWRRDRKAIRERIELALPLVTFVVSLLWLSFFREARDAMALTLLLPLALAGAHSLDRLPKGAASGIDWFGLVFFGVTALALWLYWTAAVVGTPEAAARAVERAAPGFVFTIAWLPTIIAGALTIVWLYAVARAHRNNRRAIVNWAAGITLLWVLLNLLGLPAVDHVRSYRAPVSAIAAEINRQPSCIIGTNIGEPQRAMFDYFANIRFVKPKSAEANQCQWMLMPGTKSNVPDIDESWNLKWEGARPAERLEQFRLYQRVQR
jgi:4-amino-4-deoxy-L-arabinose transferase-like glycosyltransferase